MNYIRVWDRVSADRPDKIIANSNFIAKRIKKYYKRDSTVINPPVTLDSFYAGEKTGDYFLLVGRLMAYKRFDIVIEAFKILGLKLKIIGRGPELARIQKIAGDNGNIEFLGRLSDQELFKYYAECRAFIFPQEEDFGITAIEAMASGRPVIAYRGGDIPEHVEEGKTGMFFERQTPEDIAEAVRKMDSYEFNPEYIRSTVLKFDKEIFKDKIKKYVDSEIAEHRKVR